MEVRRRWRGACEKVSKIALNAKEVKNEGGGGNECEGCMMYPVALTSGFNPSVSHFLSASGTDGRTDRRSLKHTDTHSEQTRAHLHAGTQQTLWTGGGMEGAGKSHMQL